MNFHLFRILVMLILNLADAILLSTFLSDLAQILFSHFIVFSLYNFLFLIFIDYFHQNKPFHMSNQIFILFKKLILKTINQILLVVGCQWLGFITDSSDTDGQKAVDFHPGRRERSDQGPVNSKGSLSCVALAEETSEILSCSGLESGTWRSLRILF